MLPENEYVEFEDRKYINPQVSLDEQLGFIDNLRATQQANNAEIRQDTYNLGTAVPSNLGGLVSGEGYFTSRYQTPQTNALVADLRATAQAQALSDVLKNEQEKMKQRYQKARQAYNRRNRNSGGGGGGATPTLDLDDLIETESTTQTVGSVKPAFSPAASGTFTYTPNTSTGAALGAQGVLGTGGVLNVGGVIGTGGAIASPGSVRVNRNASGVITDLTYNGKTYTGDNAEKMWSKLLDSGTISSAWR